MSFMNKLRKPPPTKRQNSNTPSVDDHVVQSRTMTLARSAVTVAAAPLPPFVGAPIPKSAMPVTRAEHYWAGRALTAEAILSAKVQHHADIRTLAVVEETKRVVSRRPGCDILGGG